MNGTMRVSPGNSGRAEQIAEKFSLQNYLGGSHDSAVFLTSLQVVGGASEIVAIKLICADKTEPEKQLQRWKSARELNHANLIRVFEVGQCEIDGIVYLYVVQEYAEENLSQILPERALTPHETREMLLPILRALQYLHGRGLIHGHIKPSNILAIGNQIKLSNDTMAMMGENGRPKPAGNIYDPPESTPGTVSGTISGTSDVWQVGATLIEVADAKLACLGSRSIAIAGNPADCTGAISRNYQALLAGGTRQAMDDLANTHSIRTRTFESEGFGIAGVQPEVGAE